MSLDLKVKLSFCTAYQQSLCTYYILQYTVLQSWNISCDIKYHLLWSLIDVRRQRPTDVPWMVVLLHTTIINWAKVTLFTIFSHLFCPFMSILKLKQISWFQWKTALDLLSPNFMFAIIIFCIFVCPKKSTDFAVDFFFGLSLNWYLFIEKLSIFWHIQHCVRL